MLLLLLLFKYPWIWTVLGKVLIDRELTCIWNSLGCPVAMGVDPLEEALKGS